MFPFFYQRLDNQIILISSIDNSCPCSSTPSPENTRLLPFFFVSSFVAVLLFPTDVFADGARPILDTVVAPSTTVDATARSVLGATGWGIISIGGGAAKFGGGPAKLGGRPGGNG